MQVPFNFEALLAFGFLSIMLLVGIALRAKISFFQKFLFPSCLIGGTLGLLLVNLKWFGIKPSLLETFAYHLFNISFISVGLTRDDSAGIGGESKKEFFKGAFWMAALQGVCFPLQAIIGGLFVIFFGRIGIELFPTFGFFAPLGFNEGPGQALSFGKVWETVGFADAPSIGLTFASIGIFTALFIGVPLANWGIRKGLATNSPKELPPEVLTGIIPKGAKYETAGELTLHSANVETLAFQAALVGLTYVLTYFFIAGLGEILGGDTAKMLWGFFFIFGMAIGLPVKWILSKFGVDYLVDPGIQRRITGWSVDYLIVAMVAAIQLSIVWKFIVPIISICIVTGILTTYLTIFFGRRLNAYNLERIVAIYGVLTGTMSNGLLLLRMVDPEFKTPVAYELAVMNLLTIPFVGTCLVLVNAPIWWKWSLGLTLAAFGGIMIVSAILIRTLTYWEKPKF